MWVRRDGAQCKLIGERVEILLNGTRQIIQWHASKATLGDYLRSVGFVKLS